MRGTLTAIALSLVLWIIGLAWVLESVAALVESGAMRAPAWAAPKCCGCPCDPCECKDCRCVDRQQR